MTLPLDRGFGKQKSVNNSRDRFVSEKTRNYSIVPLQFERSLMWISHALLCVTRFYDLLS